MSYLYISEVKPNLVLFPATINDVLSKKSESRRGGKSANVACLQINRKSQNFYRDTDRNFSVLSDKVLGDTSLHYTQELSVALSLVNFSLYSIHIQKIPLFFIKLTL